MVVEVKTKKWGNSLGVIIPAELVSRLNLKPEETLHLEVSKSKNVLEEMFGRGLTTEKNKRPSTERLLKEVRKEWLVEKLMK